jgi:hypothetical protein
MPVASVSARSQRDMGSQYISQSIVRAYRNGTDFPNAPQDGPQAVVQCTFQRARTEENKRQRAAAIVKAQLPNVARGVAEVALQNLSA